MNSRFIDIIRVFDDASLNELPVIIDCCEYMVDWSEEDEMYRFKDRFGGHFALNAGEAEEWREDGHEVNYQG